MENEEKIVQITAQSGREYSIPCVFALTNKGNIWEGMWIEQDFKWNKLPVPDFN